MLAPAALEALAAAGTVVTFGEGDLLFRQGDPAAHLYILRAGGVRLLRLLPDGRQACVGLRFAGSAVGFTTEREHGLGAEAVAEGSADRIGRAVLETLFRTFPDLERAFLDLCARELAATQDHLVALGRFDAEERVAGLLVSLAAVSVGAGRPETSVDLPLSRGGVGELLGLTTETVSRAFSAFGRRGWICKSGPRAFEILDYRALEALARGEHTP